MTLEEPGTFDLAPANGVVHHLDDDQALALYRLARSALKPGGRFVSFDGAFVDGQSAVARMFLRNDRGRHVRRAEDYERLAPKSSTKSKSAFIITCFVFPTRMRFLSAATSDAIGHSQILGTLTRVGGAVTYWRGRVRKFDRDSLYEQSDSRRVGRKTSRRAGGGLHDAIDVRPFSRSDVAALSFCVLAGILLSTLPNLIWWVKTGDPSWVSDADEVVYLEGTGLAYHQGWNYPRDPAADGGGLALGPWLAVSPFLWTSKAARVGPDGGVGSLASFRRVRNGGRGLRLGAAIHRASLGSPPR